MRPPPLFFLFAPVTTLKGVGTSISKALGRLLAGQETITPRVLDLLFHLPNTVIDRRFMPKLYEAPSNVVATFIVRIDAHQPPPGGRFAQARKTPYRILCSNDSGDITLVFFNARTEYLKQTFPIGEQRVISGMCEKFEYRQQMTHPDIVAPLSELASIQRVEPVYPLVLGLTSRRIAQLIEQILVKLPAVPEWIAPELKLSRNWPSWQEALLALHRPKAQEDVTPDSPARTRLAYDELLAQQLQLAIIREKNKSKPGITLLRKNHLTLQLTSTLPFTLTQGQQDVIENMANHMSSGMRMVRLLQGDVGSGKTIVALFAMLQAVENNYQAALMVPTEIIANQHFATLTKLCAQLPDIRITLLTGSVQGQARKDALAHIADGTTHIIVGTHALFQEAVQFHQLAVVVIDEQHRFGVEQRMKLSNKGQSPHILHMSATPIPRSLTMTQYGDMDCSLLTEKPIGRQPITTRVVPLSRYNEMMEAIQRALDKGEKIYWICPLIEPQGDTLGLHEHDKDIAAAQARAIEFTARFGDTVGLVHGRIKSEDRDHIMASFARGEKRILVATTVVEVGVDVKDATIMVIEQAEKFGLSQLHQLRGRVGRGDKPSSCVLLYNDRAGETAKQRLSILRETEDGFRIAEADLHIRGGGDVLGVRQSGLSRYHFAHIIAHEGLLIEATRDAEQYLATDPELNQERGRSLQILLELFS